MADGSTDEKILNSDGFRFLTGIENNGQSGVLFFHSSDLSKKTYIPGCYKDSSKFVGDGRGGLYMLCQDPLNKTSALLKHITSGGNDENIEPCRFEYPWDSKLAGDGQGGVWLLCPTDGENCSKNKNANAKWTLWHVRRERSFDDQGDKPSACAILGEYEEVSGRKYPAHSRLVGDGFEGVFIRCSKNKHGWKQYHEIRDFDEVEAEWCPGVGKFCSDGMSGVWSLCYTKSGICSTILMFLFTFLIHICHFLFFKKKQKRIVGGCGMGAVIICMRFRSRQFLSVPRLWGIL